MVPSRHPATEGRPLSQRAPRTSDRAIDWGSGGGNSPGSGAIATTKAEWADLEWLWRARARRQGSGYIIGDRVSVPVGLRVVPTLDPSSQGLPQLVSSPTINQEAPVPPLLDRRDIAPLPPSPPPPPGSHLTPQQLLDAQWLVRMGHIARVEDYQPPNTVVAATPPIFQEDTDVGWISDVYDTVDTAFGGMLPGGVAPQYGQGPLEQYSAPAPVVIQQGGGGVPPAVISGGACGADDPSRGMVYKKVCGQYKWVKQKRRRRRGLATKGDLRDLASLKGILGTGKAFEVWIATHS